MEKSNELYSDINTLLRFLDGGPMSVIELVNNYYSIFGNSAPGELLKIQIERVQKHLDNWDNNVLSEF